MSRNNLLGLVLSFGLLFGFVSCKNEDDNLQNSEDVQTTVQSGSWKITSFIDSGKNETSDFIGYTFQFLSDGKLSAVKGSNTLTGSWSVTNSHSGDDSNDDLHFNILFNNVNDDFEDLNDDWHFISKSETKIELIDVSGGNGGTDYLTFEKI